MPRSSRSSGGRSAPSGSRGTHTMAGSRPQQQPVHQAHQNAPARAQQAQQGRSPGLFGQMASTAAGVAVGSTVGHSLSNMLFGGGGGAVDQAQQADPPAGQWSDGQASNSSGTGCEVQSKDFLRCLDATGNNMDSCAYYLDQLKACQAAARPY